MKLTSIVLSIYLYSAKLSLLRFGVSLVMLIILSTSSNLVFAQHLSVEEIDTLINESFAIRTSDLNSLARNIDSLEAHNDLLSPFQRQNLTFLIAHQVSMKGNYQGAIALYQQLDNSEFLEIKIKSLSSQLNLQLLTNNYRASNLLIDKLLESSTTLNNNILLSQTYQMIAYYYNHINEFSLAKTFIDLVDQSILTPREECRFNHHKALTHLGLGRIKGNATFIIDAITQCREQKEHIIANSLLLENVRYLNLQKQFKNALLTLDKHDEFIFSTNFKPQLVMYYAVKSIAYLETEQLQLAKEYGLKTLNQNASIDGLKWRQTAFLTLSKVAEIEGDFKLAHDYLVTYEKISLDLVDLELQRQLGAAQAKHNYFGLLEKKKQVIKRYSQAVAQTAGLDSKLQELRKLSEHYLSIATVLAVILTVSFLILLYIRLQRQGESNKSRLDTLTGLYNRTSFVDISSSAMYNMSKKGHPITMLNIDIDNFREFNHQYGYNKGDELLIELAKILQQHSKSWFNLARMGSNDFAMIFPHSSLNEILVMCNLLQEKIKGLGKAVGLNTANITVSIGISDSTLSDYAFKNYISDLSKSLIKAKKLGGNQVVIFDSSMTKRHLYKSNSSNLKYVYEKFTPKLRTKSVKL